MSEVVRYVHLVGVGDLPALPAEQLVEGDVIYWNYGHPSTVVNYSAPLLIERTEAGELHARRKKPGTLVACKRAVDAEQALPFRERVLQRRAFAMAASRGRFRLTQEQALELLREDDPSAPDPESFVRRLENALP